MIDIENEVFTKLATVLRAEFAGIDVSSEYQRKPSKMPHVSIELADTYPDRTRISNNTEDNGDIVMFEINIYSNKASGKKQECKKIAQKIDETLRRLNLRRTSLTPVPNLEDSTIYRMTGRWTGLVDETHIYRR